ncbi:hypothetical protein [Aureimonas sp. AU12]|uniref:hypothetical protein n=1 Tax=Aureimonas sp. AU12 TaxID=1638161 RepID=UPI0007827C60|nr:hypothetical protein [Aureimonas sp. AU12]
MPFIDCLNSAIEQGAITRAEGEALNRDFETKYAQKKLQLGDDGAAQAAKDELARELKAQAIEKRRRAVLTEKARVRLKDRLLGYRDEQGRPDVYEAAVQTLSHYGYAGAESVRGREEAIVSMAHGKLTDLMTATSRSLLRGRRTASAGLVRDIVRELHGEASADATAKTFAGDLSRVFEDLRNRFNAAGGAIPKLDGWGLPHSHNGLAVRQAGREAWKEFIKPLVDPDKILHPLTAEPVGVAGLDKALDHVFESITTTGWAHHAPQMKGVGAGSLATQRQEHRFLAFKSADDWMTYNQSFGGGDPVQAMFRHINGMAKDIAALEVLGPNPNAMMQWMVQGVRSEIAKGDVGRASMARIAGDMAKWARGTEPGAFAEWRLQALYAELRGGPNVASGVATATATVKNLMNSALLGGAGVTAALTDPFVAQASRRLAGLPVVKDMGAMLKMLKASNREEIQRAGVIWDDYLHAMEGEARFTGPMLGHTWSQYLVDRSMMLNGLKPLTTGRKLVEARAWQATIADHAGTDFGKLPERLRVTMEGFGIDAADWEVMRASVDPAGFVTPMSIANGGGEVRYLAAGPDGPLVDAELMAEGKALRHREVAEKLAEMTAAWSERATPGGTPNARSFVTGPVARGTFLGEFANFAMQFKSFGLSFTTLQLEALQRITAMQSGGKQAAAGYFAAMAISLTIGGAMSNQIKGLLDGKDLEDMSTGSFWFKASMTGGGFGLFGDFVNSSSNRFGGGVADTVLGPGWSFLSDAVGLGVGLPLQAALGEKVNPGRKAVDFAGRYTPVVASNWATRGGYRRLVLDQLQWLVDPDADKSFKAKASGLKGRTGQEYWWAPGQVEPGRAPAIAAPPEPRN